MDEQTAIQTYGDGGLSLNRPAEVVFKEAEMVVTPWARRVESLKLYKEIGPSKHLFVEAWQMLGACYRVSTRLVCTTYLDYGEVKGFEARVEAVHMPTGQVIGTADAMCLNDEENWGPRAKYEWQTPEGGGPKIKTQVGYVNTPLQQLRSMAQTRAQSKVLASLFKWVARMKGFQGTPAEEMTGREYDEQPGEKQGANFRPPQRKTADGQPGPDREHCISEPQSKRMYAIAMGKGWDKQNYNDWLKSKGFSGSREISTNQYDDLVAQLEAA
jgi:hypothetical protein